jgi:hypothetical protein
VDRRLRINRNARPPITPRTRTIPATIGTVVPPEPRVPLEVELAGEAPGPVDGVPVVFAPGPGDEVARVALDADVAVVVTMLVMNVSNAKSGHGKPASAVVSQEENCINA